MVKKLIAFILASVLALSLAACGADPSMPSPSSAEITITGTVTDATMNVTTIKTAEGKELSFATADATVEMKDGLLLGDVVAITYKGDIKDGDTSGATVLRLTDGGDNSKNPLRQSSSEPESAPEAAEEELMLTGTVLAAGMSAITIETGDGTELSFLMDGAENLLTEGPQEGQSVTLVYKGEIVDSDTSTATLLRIEPVAK